jgi:hypothetical protein
MNIFESLLKYKDLIYYLLDYISFDDLFNLSILNHSFYNIFQDILSHEFILTKIKSKCRERKCKVLNLAAMQFYFREGILVDQIDPNFYTKYNLTSGDVININNKKCYILYRNSIYSTDYFSQVTIPKVIQNKFHFDFWKSLSEVVLFIEIRLEDFDFENCAGFYEFGITYIRIWHKKHRIYVWTYLMLNYNEKNYSVFQQFKFEFQNLARVKIKSIMNNCKVQNIDSRFQNGNDVKIFLLKVPIFSKNKEWYIE